MYIYHLNTDNHFNQDKRQNLLTAFGIFIISATMYLSSPMFLAFGRSYIFPVMIFAGPILYFVLSTRASKSPQKAWNTYEITLTKVGIKRYYKGKSDFIPFNEITKITYKKNRRNKVKQINLYTSTFGFALANLKDIEHLLAQILEYIPKSTEMKQKRMWIDWERPVEKAIGFVLLVFGAAIYGQILSLDSTFLITVLMIVFGGWFLLKKPITWNAGLTYKSTQTFIGIAAIAIGLAFFGISYLSDGPAAYGNAPCGWIGKHIHQTGCIKSISFDDNIAFLPDDTIAGQEFRKILFRPLNGLVGIWTPLLRHDDYINGFQTSANGEILVSHHSNYPENSTILIWETPSRTLLREFETPFNISPLSSDELVLSGNGRFLAIPSQNGKVIWQIDPWQKQLTLSEPGHMTFHPNEEMIAKTSIEPIKLIDWSLAKMM